MKSISEIKAEFSMAQPSQLAELMRRYADDPRSGVQKILAKGGEYDYAKAASMFMDDFRNGRIGRISLEKPSEENK